MTPEKISKRVISQKELYTICTDDLNDIRQLRDAFLNWIKTHPDKLDETL
jgi:hypothetical protein